MRTRLPTNGRRRLRSIEYTPHARTLSRASRPATCNAQHATAELGMRCALSQSDTAITVAADGGSLTPESSQHAFEAWHHDQIMITSSAAIAVTMSSEG